MRKRNVKASYRRRGAGRQRFVKLDQKIERLLKRAAEDEPPTHFFERGTYYLERFWLTRLVFVFGTFFALIAMWIYYEEWVDRKEERQVRKEERVVRAWQQLVFDGSGNSGKASALEYLVDSGVRIIGLNLAAKNFERGAFFDRLNLSNETISRSSFSFSRFFDVSFDNVEFINSRIDHTYFNGFMRMHLYDSDASSAIFELSDGSALNTNGVNFDSAYFKFPVEGIVSRPFYLEFKFSIMPYKELLEKLRASGLSSEEAFAKLKNNKDVLEHFSEIFDIWKYPESLSLADEYFGGNMEYEDFAENLSEVYIASDELVNIGFGTSYSSLRCVTLPYIQPKFFIGRSNISGADFSVSGLTYGGMGEMFHENFYFSDNPPKGVPNRVLDRMTSIEREEALKMCKNDSWDGYFSKASAVCHSILRMPKKCIRQEYIYDSISTYERDSRYSIFNN